MAEIGLDPLGLVFPLERASGGPAPSGPAGNDGGSFGAYLREAQDSRRPPPVVDQRDPPETPRRPEDDAASVPRAAEERDEPPATPRESPDDEPPASHAPAAESPPADSDSHRRQTDQGEPAQPTKPTSDAPPGRRNRGAASGKEAKAAIPTPVNPNEAKAASPEAKGKDNIAAEAPAAAPSDPAPTNQPLAAEATAEVSMELALGLAAAATGATGEPTVKPSPPSGAADAPQPPTTIPSPGSVESIGQMPDRPAPGGLERAWLAAQSREAGRDSAPGRGNSRAGARAASVGRTAEPSGVEPAAANNTNPAAASAVEIQPAPPAVLPDLAAAKPRQPESADRGQPPRPSVEAPAMSRPSGETAANATASGDAAADPTLSPADRVRFVERVARAFRAVGDWGGTIRMRLFPPELGALRLEMTVRHGTVTARLETDNTAAQRILVENLPVLRERLAEHNLRVDRFDVDVMDQPADGSTHRSPERTPQHPDDGRGGRSPAARESVAAEPVRARPRGAGEGRGLDVVI